MPSAASAVMHFHVTECEIRNFSRCADMARFPATHRLPSDNMERDARASSSVRVHQCPCPTPNLKGIVNRLIQRTDPLSLRELVEIGGPAKSATIPGCAHATKGYVELVVHSLVVHVHHAGVNAGR